MVQESKLTKLLSTLVNLAERKPGRTQMLPLTNGLTVSIRVEGVTHLTISRMESYPSNTEWRTIVNHWPYPVEPVAPKEIENGRRKHLYAIIHRSQL